MTKRTAPDLILTLEEVAELLKVSTATIRRYTKRSHQPLPFLTLGGRTMRFRAEDVNDWLNKQRSNYRGKKEPEPSVPAPVGRVWKNYLRARAKHCANKGRKDVAPPTLTPAIQKQIEAAIAIHGEDKANYCGIGIFLSDFHLDEKHQMKAHLVWRMEPRDNVEEFSRLYLEAMDKKENRWRQQKTNQKSERTESIGGAARTG